MFLIWCLEPSTSYPLQYLQAAPRDPVFDRFFAPQSWYYVPSCQNSPTSVIPFCILLVAVNDRKISYGFQACSTNCLPVSTPFFMNSGSTHIPVVNFCISILPQPWQSSVGMVHHAAYLVLTRKCPYSYWLAIFVVIRACISKRGVIVRYCGRRSCSEDKKSKSVLWSGQLRAACLSEGET